MLGLLVFAQPITDILLPRQEGDYLYLTGVDEPGGILLLGPKTETLYLLQLSKTSAQFFGHDYLAGEKADEALGVKTAPLPRRASEAYKALLDALPEGVTLHMPRYGGSDHATVRERRRRLADHLKANRPDVKIVNLSPTLHAQRAIKDAWEIEQLRRAIAITVEGFEAVRKPVRETGTETDVESAFYTTIRKRGARTAFPMIAGSGRNGAIPHYFKNEAPLVPKSLMVMDAGAAVHRYAADITRTFPVGGKFTDETRRLYDAVLACQEAAIAVAKPGATFRDLSKAARAVLKKHDLDSYFIHGISHQVGLDVHDPGGGRLRKGMVFTIEPGVYLLEKKIGVRIEDMFLVTETGVEMLTGALPRTAADVEAWLSR